MLHALITGLVLGAASGLIPGPLQALVITQSAQHGWRSGLQVALAPLITDSLIVAVTTWLLSHVPGQILHGMTLLGAGMVGYIALDAWNASRRAANQAAVSAAAADDPLLAAAAPTPSGDRGSGLWQGVLLNLVNPHAWLFGCWSGRRC